MPVASEHTSALVSRPPLAAPWEMLTNTRDRLRAELRYKIDMRLQELTGSPDARMRWTEDEYARLVVLRHEAKIKWPADVPFLNLSDIRGGVRPLEQLREHWNTGVLCLERATAEDLVKAARDPRTVHPNPDLISKRPAPAAGVVVESSALYPGTLAFLGVHPTSTQPAAVESILGKRSRDQRIDVKRPRVRPVTNPLNLPLRRRKRGVTSRRYVFEPESEIEDFSDAEERARKRARYLCTDDPIEEFL
ncbi:hypothetical protein PYCCODRAFT_1465373 [Trametes coccinea BRFM310]|uniref:Uncharacterized protein n=1 Tax=Trametes coccinea (strain BRFM310) TaxID=1353009 RepID=A0A1Y2IWM2_TRAC3|nr:hypothetical protein PYCCODRAFT_1465373 [Trametes coccinea BRFM310]